MKKSLRLIPGLLALTLLPTITSCSDDDDPVDNREVVTLGFENTGAILAGPTSYGANLYYGFEGTQFTGADIPVTGTTSLHIGVNRSSWSNQIEFYGGGLALSKWNIRSNTEASQAANWWYTYENQCSVYNLASTDGANTKAGADGSDTFLVAFGRSENGDMAGCASMNFTGGAEYSLETIDVCNDAYTYGVLMNGNPFGLTPDKNIEQAGGWFKVEFYGFDAQGNPTNGGRPVEFYLCDYRAGSATAVATISRWTKCDLSALGKVNMVKVDFKGSDTGKWGLNTPSYVCLDNLRVVTVE